MKTRPTHPQQPETITSAVPPEDEDTFGAVDEPVETPTVPITEPPRENRWRSIDDAPKDRIIEGRFSTDEEVGRPIKWRHSRRRGKIDGQIGYHWIPGGVWHAAETAGAVQLHPIEWREWEQAHYFIPERESADEAA